VNGVELYTPTSGATYSDITITGLFFADIRVDYATYSPADSRWGKALEIGIGSGVLSNFSLSNCVGIRMDTFFSQVTTIDGLNLIGNTVAQCGGNCYFVGSVHNLVMRDSVFLRDTPANLFLYGTTDIVNIPPPAPTHTHTHTHTHAHTDTPRVPWLTYHTHTVRHLVLHHPSIHTQIFGSITGENVVVNNDFNRRGEYQGGPDGCAIDFETSASGTTIANNTIYHSWGGGVMIFGHDTTSHDLAITGNTFAYDGCVQARGDHGGVAIMCPNGHAPSGVIEDNTFLTCPGGIGGIYVNPDVKDCAANLTITRNANNTIAMVEQPQVNINPVRERRGDRERERERACIPSSSSSSSSFVSLSSPLTHTALLPPFDSSTHTLHPSPLTIGRTERPVQFRHDAHCREHDDGWSYAALHDRRVPTNFYFTRGSC